MNSYDTSKSVDATQSTRQEIEILRQELSEALKNATFVGMTPEEAQAYDARRQRLTLLFERLREIKPSKEEPEPIA